MSYVDEQEKKPIWRGLLSAVGGIVAFVIVKFGFAAYHNSESSVGASFDAEIAKPPFNQLYEAMKSEFPVEFDAFRLRLIKDAASGASNSEIRTAGFTEMRQFSIRHAKDLAQAPTAYLTQYRRAQIELITKPRNESTVLCAHFGMSGLQPSDKPSVELLALMAKIGALGVKASAAGRDTPMKRSLVVSDADGNAFAGALQRLGLTDSDAVLLGNSASLASARV